MTREEAIAELKKRYLTMSQCLDKEDLHKANEAIDMAIEALQTEPCEDAISRQAVLDEIDKVCFSRGRKWIEFRINNGSNGERDYIINYIKQLPYVNPPQIPAEKGDAK